MNEFYLNNNKLINNAGLLKTYHINVNSSMSSYPVCSQLVMCSVIIMMICGRVMMRFMKMMRIVLLMIVIMSFIQVIGNHCCLRKFSVPMSDFWIQTSAFDFASLNLKNKNNIAVISFSLNFLRNRFIFFILKINRICAKSFLSHCKKIIYQ